jgi:hypothetical protein
MSWRDMKPAFQLVSHDHLPFGVLFRVRLEREDNSLLKGMFSVRQFVGQPVTDANGGK